MEVITIDYQPVEIWKISVDTTNFRGVPGLGRCPRIHDEEARLPLSTLTLTHETQAHLRRTGVEDFFANFIVLFFSFFCGVGPKRLFKQQQTRRSRPILSIKRAPVCAEEQHTQKSRALAPPKVGAYRA